MHKMYSRSNYTDASLHDWINGKDMNQRVKASPVQDLQSNSRKLRSSIHHLPSLGSDVSRYTASVCGMSEVVLEKWIIQLCLGSPSIRVCGIDTSGRQRKSGAITMRIHSRSVLTGKGTVYKLIGRIQSVRNIPEWFESQFCEGFPANWKVHVQKLIACLKQTESDDEMSQEETDHFIQNPNNIEYPGLPAGMCIKQELYQWSVGLKKEAIFVKAYIIKTNGKPQLCRTSAIKQVCKNTFVITASGSVYSLKGRVSLEGTVRGNVPLWLARKFDKGFPNDWRSLVSNFCERRKQGECGMLFENSNANHPMSVSKTVKTTKVKPGSSLPVHSLDSISSSHSDYQNDLRSTIATPDTAKRRLFVSKTEKNKVAAHNGTNDQSDLRSTGPTPDTVKRRPFVSKTEKTKAAAYNGTNEDSLLDGDWNKQFIMEACVKVGKNGTSSERTKAPPTKPSKEVLKGQSKTKRQVSSKGQSSVEKDARNFADSQRCTPSVGNGLYRTRSQQQQHVLQTSGCIRRQYVQDPLEYSPKSKSSSSNIIRKPKAHKCVKTIIFDSCTSTTNLESSLQPDAICRSVIRKKKPNEASEETDNDDLDIERRIKTHHTASDVIQRSPYLLRRSCGGFRSKHATDSRQAKQRTSQGKKYSFYTNAKKKIAADTSESSSDCFENAPEKQPRRSAFTKRHREDDLVSNKRRRFEDKASTVESIKRPSTVDTSHKLVSPLLTFKQVPSNCETTKQQRNTDCKNNSVNCEKSSRHAKDSKKNRNRKDKKCEGQYNGFNRENVKAISSTALVGKGKQTTEKKAFVEINARRGTLKRRHQIKDVLSELNKQPGQDLFQSDATSGQMALTFGEEYFQTNFDLQDSTPFTPSGKCLIDFNQQVATPAWFKTPNAEGAMSFETIDTPHFLRTSFTNGHEMRNADSAVADRVVIQMQKNVRKKSKAVVITDQETVKKRCNTKSRKTRGDVVIPTDLFHSKGVDDFSDEDDYFTE